MNHRLPAVIGALLGTLVLGSHGSTISALTGIMPDSRERVVVTPQGAGRFTVAGRLTAHGP